MKRIIGILVFTFFIGNTFAQDISSGNVPAVVLNAFQLKFPNAEYTKWKLEKGNYCVRYKVNSKEHKLILDFKGNVIRHDQDLYVSEIPKEVLDIIKSKVAFFDVHDADRIEENNQITYDINFNISGKEYFFLIDNKGKLLKFTKELINSEIPTAIASLIKSRYGSLDIDYSKYSEDGTNNVYIIKGEIADNEHYFIINDKAAIVKHKQELKNTEIPVAILNSAKSAYPGFEIRNAGLLEEGDKATYELRLRKSKESVRVLFDKNGKILQVK